MSFTWSHSRLKDFELCPRYYEAKYVKRLKEPEHESAAWGNRIHKDLEVAVATQTPMPEATKSFQWATRVGDEAKQIGATVQTEWKLGVTAKLQPCGFFEDGVWLRAIIDLAVVGDTVASIWDYKSGRPRTGNSQLTINAAVVFAHTAVERVEARYLWLQTRRVTGTAHERGDLPRIWEDLISRANRMERATQLGVFQPIPSWKCKYCHVRSCEHNESGGKR